MMKSGPGVVALILLEQAFAGLGLATSPGVVVDRSCSISILGLWGGRFGTSLFEGRGFTLEAVVKLAVLASNCRYQFNWAVFGVGHGFVDCFRGSLAEELIPMVLVGLLDCRSVPGRQLKVAALGTDECACTMLYTLLPISGMMPVYIQ